MIRMAVALSILTLVLHDSLPSWRAKFTRPIHQQCLKYTPHSEIEKVREIQQSLVCGKNLKMSESLQSWKDLGLIHILVVSGGHLTILSKMLMALMMFLTFGARTPAALGVVKFIVLIAVSALAVANQFEPPVLRAWLDYLFRPVFKRNGWQSNETSFATTWMALPAIADQADLLSLALSFFASVVVESVSQRHQDHPVLLAVSLQCLLWWALLPLLLPLGLPHPIATLTNVLLAPLIGAVLIPAALLSYLFQIEFLDKILASLWLSIWQWTEKIVQFLGGHLPQAAPAMDFGRPRWTALTYAALITLGLSLIARTQVKSRLERRAGKNFHAWIAALVLLLIASTAHWYLREKKGPPDSIRVSTQVSAATSPQRAKTKRGKVCIPYQAIERRARSKHCRRTRSNL